MKHMNIHTTLHIKVLLPRLGNRQKAIWLWMRNMSNLKEIVINIRLSKSAEVDEVKVFGDHRFLKNSAKFYDHSGNDINH